MKKLIFTALILSVLELFSKKSLKEKRDHFKKHFTLFKNPNQCAEIHKITHEDILTTLLGYSFQKNILRKPLKISHHYKKTDYKTFSSISIRIDHTPDKTGVRFSSYTLEGAKIFYFKNHDLHRDHGPAYIGQKNNAKEYYKDGFYDKDSGPHCLWGIKSFEYRNKNNNLHRIGGPASYNEKTRTTSYYRNGLLHRIDGPAYIHKPKEKSWHQERWYLEGKDISFLTPEEKEYKITQWITNSTDYNAHEKLDLINTCQKRISKLKFKKQKIIY